MTIGFENLLSKVPFLNKLSENNKFKRTLYVFSLVCLLITFSLSISLESIVPFNYVAIIMFGLFIGFTTLYIVLYGKLYINRVICLYAIFLLIQYISTLVNLFPYFTRTPTLMCLLSVFVYEFIMQFDHKEKILKIVCWFSTTLLILFFFKYFSNVIRPDFSKRIGTYFGNENDVARHLSFCLISMLILIKCSKKVLFKILAVFFAALSLYFVLLTGSISNTIVDILVICAFILLMTKKKGKIIFFIFFVLIIIGSIIALNQPIFAPIKNRITRIINTFVNLDGVNGTDSSSEGRFYGAIYGFKLFLQNPIFGNGYRSVHRNFNIMSHNNIAEIASDFGVVALIAEEIIICGPMINRKSRKSIFILFNIYILIFQFFLVSYNAKIESIILPLILSLMGDSILFNSDNYMEIKI